MKKTIYTLIIIGLLSFLGYYFIPTNIKVDIQNMLEVKKEQSGTIYFVRHAQKVKDVENPPLTMQGRQRAKELSDYLGNLNIQSIYTTNYVRTKSTAMPLANKQGIKVEIYDKKNTDILMEMVLNRGGNTLVVGHWGTANDAFKYFGEEAKYDTEKVNNNDSILKVTYSKNKPTEVVLLQY